MPDEEDDLSFDNDDLVDQDDGDGLEPGPSLSVEDVRTLAPSTSGDHVLLGPETGMEDMR